MVPKAAEKNIVLHTMINANVPEEVIGDASSAEANIEQSCR